MNLFEPVLESVRKFLPSVFRVTDQEFINGNRLGRIFGVGGNETTGKESQIYKNHPWTYSAINAIARNISGVPFVFMSQKGRMSGDHKFVELFEKPNRWEGLGQFRTVGKGLDSF
jgi:phage portal protein BeeE